MPSHEHLAMHYKDRIDKDTARLWADWAYLLAKSQQILSMAACSQHAETPSTTEKAFV